jgi:peptide/nickel transport system permease protein
MSEPAPTPIPGRSSFDIAMAMFTRNRTAMVAAALLALFFLGAIWAPLLATASPLRFRGVDEGTGRQAARIAMLEVVDLTDALENGLGWKSGHVERSFDTVEFQIERLLEHVGASRAESAGAVLEKVRSLRERWTATAARGSPGDAPSVALGAEIRPLIAGWTEALQPSASDFEVRTRWPAFRGLGFFDVFLMAFSLTATGATLFWLSRRRRGLKPGGPATFALGSAVVLGVVGALWSPDRMDATDYKRGLADGSITAESVLYAPVPFGINESSILRTLEAPLAGSGDHIMGTDELGRDTLCRMLWGARVSLSVGFVAVGIYVLIGIIIGAIAGFFGGWVDIVVSRLIEWVICFPVFFLILVIVAFLQDRTLFGADPPQLLVIMVVIGITGWTSVARLVRAEFLRLVGQDFVLAARAIGAGDARIMFVQVLPNAMGPVLVAATFGVAGAILTESALSFLGLGISVPHPSWGAMLFAAHGYEQSSVWIFLWPGLAIFMVITCYNLVGEALRDALDPRLRQ